MAGIAEEEGFKKWVACAIQGVLIDLSGSFNSCGIV